MTRKAQVMKTTLISLAAALALGAPAAAEDDWSFTLSPYGWAMSLTGSAVVNGSPADVDLGFDTLLENFNFGGMVEMRARRGRFGGFTHVSYGKVSADETNGPDTVSVSSSLTFIEFGASYMLEPMTVGTSAQVTLEPYAGARYTAISLDASINSFDGSETMRWIDPIIGLRSHWRLSERWQANVSGDIGGFGVGSDFSWNVLAVAGYDFNVVGERDGSAFLGYRALGQDYGDGSGAGRQEWDVITHGPVVGISVRF
jgi:hypothetical protein